MTNRGSQNPLIRKICAIYMYMQCICYLNQASRRLHSSLICALHCPLVKNCRHILSRVRRNLVGHSLAEELQPLSVRGQ